MFALDVLIIEIIEDTVVVQNVEYFNSECDIN